MHLLSIQVIEREALRLLAKHQIGDGNTQTLSSKRHQRYVDLVITDKDRKKSLDEFSNKILLPGMNTLAEMIMKNKQKIIPVVWSIPPGCTGATDELDGCSMRVLIIRDILHLVGFYLRFEVMCEGLGWGTLQSKGGTGFTPGFQPQTPVPPPADDVAGPQPRKPQHDPSGRTPSPRQSNPAPEYTPVDARSQMPVTQHCISEIDKQIFVQESEPDLTDQILHFVLRNRRRIEYLLALESKSDRKLFLALYDPSQSSIHLAGLDKLEVCRLRKP